MIDEYLKREKYEELYGDDMDLKKPTRNREYGDMRYATMERNPRYEMNREYDKEYDRGFEDGMRGEHRDDRDRRDNRDYDGMENRYYDEFDNRFRKDGFRDQRFNYPRRRRR